LFAKQHEILLALPMTPKDVLVVNLV